MEGTPWYSRRLRAADLYSFLVVAGSVMLTVFLISLLTLLFIVLLLLFLRMLSILIVGVGGGSRTWRKREVFENSVREASKDRSGGGS